MTTTSPFSSNTSNRHVIFYHFQHVCIFFFQQLIGQQMVQLKNSILECLHHHTISSTFFDMIFEVHCVRILSCFNLEVRAIIRLVFLAFQLSSPIYITFHTQLGLPHLFIANILWCVCTHHVNPMGIHLLRCAHGNECMGTHDVVCDTFVAIAWDASFHVGWKQSYALPSTTFNSSIS